MMRLEDVLRNYPVRRSKLKCIVCNGSQWEFPFSHYKKYADICAKCRIVKWADEGVEGLSESNTIILLAADLARDWYFHPVQEAK